MFKKVTRGKGSPVFSAEMRCYVVARDDEKYARWMLGISKKLDGVLEMAKAELGENKGKEKATDIFSGTLAIAKEDITFSSRLPSREKPGEYFEVPYHTGFCTGIRYFAGTRSGRPLTDDERKSLAKSAEKAFSIRSPKCNQVLFKKKDAP